LEALCHDCDMNSAEKKAAVAGVFDRGSGSYEQLGPQFFTPMGLALVTRAAISPGERILDVGCGRGSVLFPAAEATGPTGSVVGIDLAPGMVALTAAAAEPLGHVQVLQGDAAAPDFPDAEFDVVLAGLVVFFLPDPTAALTEYARVLKPGGRLAFTTFGPADPHFEQAVKTIGGFVPGAPEQRPAEFFRDPESITEMLTGWAEVTITDQTVETRFTGPSQWWDWLWSHGVRGMLEQIPAERLDAAREAAVAVMEGARTPEGDLAIHTGIRVTTARRG
jgi:ubiquinone/menaquinone biosynthesis C-methylase UbiE